MLGKKRLTLWTLNVELRSPISSLTFRSEERSKIRMTLILSKMNLQDGKIKYPLRIIWNL